MDYLNQRDIIFARMFERIEGRLEQMGERIQVARHPTPPATPAREPRLEGRKGNRSDPNLRVNFDVLQDPEFPLIPVQCSDVFAPMPQRCSESGA